MNVGLIGIRHETSQSPILNLDLDTDPDQDPDPDSNQFVGRNLQLILHLCRVIRQCRSMSTSKSKSGSRSRNENHRVSRRKRFGANKGPVFLGADYGTDVALCLPATLSTSSFRWEHWGHIMCRGEIARKSVEFIKAAVKPHPQTNYSLK